MRSLRWLLPMLVIVLGLPAAALPAAAHAILVESTPAAGSQVEGPSVAFSLRYNSRIDKARSRLTLTGPDKSEIVLTIAAGGSEDILTSDAQVTPGAYKLHWQVLAIDGHITRGDVAFAVTASTQ